MSFLADTCALLRLENEPEVLSLSARRALSGEFGAVYISAVTLAELACLCRRSRIQLSEPWADWFQSRVDRYNWTVLPVDAEIFIKAYSLPEPFHNDPADRIIVATAVVYALSVVTTDLLILGYPHVQSLR